MRDPWILVCGVMCLYPLLVFAIPAYLIGRYRPRFRSPIVTEHAPRANDPRFSQQARSVARRPAPPPSSDIGFGGGPQ